MELIGEKMIAFAPLSIMPLMSLFSCCTFDCAFVVSSGRGGPSDSTLLYTLYLYQWGFTDFRMGFASAMAWVLLVVIGVLTALLFRGSRRWVFYAGEGR